MDMYPKTTFVSSPETEIERVLHTTAVLASGFYERKGFVILPELPKANSEGIVLIPRLPYSEIRRYWSRAKSLKIQIPTAGEELAEDLKVEWSARGVSRTTLNKREEEWRVMESEFWKQLSLVMPHEIKMIGEVEVRLSKWGTVSSYRFLTKKAGQKLVVYLRVDVGVEQLAEAVLTALLWPLREEVGVTWSRREAIVDFVLTRGKLGKLLKGYKPTLLALPRVSAKLREKGERYLMELGVPREEKGLYVSNGSVYFNGKSLKGELGNKEEVVLGELIEHRGEVVSFDTIADLIWGEGEFRTFWAINKLVQRLRKKLSAIGINDIKIVTKRGRGYILTSSSAGRYNTDI